MPLFKFTGLTLIVPSSEGLRILLIKENSLDRKKNITKEVWGIPGGGPDIPITVPEVMNKSIMELLLQEAFREFYEETWGVFGRKEELPRAEKIYHQYGEVYSTFFVWMNLTSTEMKSLALNFKRFKDYHSEATANWEEEIEYVDGYYETLDLDFFLIEDIISDQRFPLRRSISRETLQKILEF